MDTEKKPVADINDYIKQLEEENPSAASIPSANLFAAKSGTSTSEPQKPASPLDQQPQDFAIAKDTPAAPAPAPTPSADLEQPAAPESSELATSTGKRPLAHFGQALPATKSKANRKLVLQLTPEEYQFLSLVAALPELNGVALPDLARAVLKAWREDYRPDIKKAVTAAFNFKS